MKALARLSFLLLCCLGACVAAPPAIPPTVRAVVLDPTLAPFASAWRRETARRYDTCVIVFVHGLSDGYTWTLWTTERGPLPAETVIRAVQAEYPGERLVLVACNPGATPLCEPGVTYALHDVWLIPDRALQPALRRLVDPEVGDVFEMIENPMESTPCPSLNSPAGTCEDTPPVTPPLPSPL